MSTETTNKKIKIDNGTTFGRTYTDKAVDELLKNAGLPVVEGTINETGDTITIPSVQTTNFILHFNTNGVDTYALINNVMAVGDTAMYASIMDIGFNEQTGAIINCTSIDGNGTDLFLTSLDVPDPLIASKTIPLFGKYNILVPKDSADTNILPLPADASTKTYTLKAVNGVLTWVEG